MKKSSLSLFLTFLLMPGMLRAQDIGFVTSTASSEELASIYLEAANLEMEGSRQKAELLNLAVECLAKAASETEETNYKAGFLIRASRLAANNGNYGLATEYINTAIDLEYKSNGESSPMYMYAVLEAAAICRDAGDAVQSQGILEKARKLYRKYGDGPLMGMDTLSYVEYLKIAGGNCSAAGKYRSALRFANKAARLEEKYYASIKTTPPLDIYDGPRKAAAELEGGRPMLEARYSGTLRKLHATDLDSNFSVMSEFARERYWKKMTQYYDQETDIPFPGKRTARDIYDIVLMSKGILLNTSMEFSRVVMSSGDSISIEALKRMNELIVTGADAEAVDSLDKMILGRLKDGGLKLERPESRITWKDVREALGPDDLAIEYFVTGNHYRAALLRKYWSAPKIVDIDNPSPYYGKDIASSWSARKDIWPRAITRHFPRTPKGRVFFSPDGLLNLMCIEYLQLSKDKRSSAPTIADCYPVFRLSSTRQLVRGSNKANVSRAGIYGAARFDMTSASEKLAVDALDAGGRRLVDIRHEDALERGQVYSSTFDPLVQTVRESHAVDTIIIRSGLDSDIFTGIYANEEAVKRHSPSENILHFATHGFYVTAGDARKNSYYATMFSSNPRFIQDPLYRSGLHLAGAASSWNGLNAKTSTSGDGVLTSKEISMMDLSSTDLVVLSACQTGLGDIERDGVFGLQRAFKKAGVGTMILSLWEVNDEATRIMMETFYTNKFLLGEDTRTAFMKAQNTLRKTDAFSSIEYWGAFVLIDAEITK